MSYTDAKGGLKRILNRANRLGLPAWASAHADKILAGCELRWQTVRADWRSGKIDRATYDRQYARTVNELCYTQHVISSFLGSLPREDHVGRFLREVKNHE